MSYTQADWKLIASVNNAPKLLTLCTTSIVGIVWSWMVLGIRIYVRSKLNGPIGKDDYASILATVVATGQSVSTLSIVFIGLSRSNGDWSLHSYDMMVKVSTTCDMDGHLDASLKLFKAGYAYTLLYMLCRYTSQLASCLFYTRLAAKAAHLTSARAGIVVTLAGGFASTFVIAFQCRSPMFWSVVIQKKCIDTVMRNDVLCCKQYMLMLFSQWNLWLGLELSATALELFIFGISFVLVWSLQMSVRKKVSVVLAFSIRLL